MSIREATRADLEPIFQLTLQFVGETVDVGLRTDHQAIANNLVEHLEDTDGFLWVMVNDKTQEIVGFLAGLMYSPLFTTDKIVSELFWFVEREHRGNRNSVDLLNKMETWGRDKGAVMTTASAIKGLKSLGKLYEGLGYSIKETTYSKKL